jgi:hypothetical protein
MSLPPLFFRIPIKSFINDMPVIKKTALNHMAAGGFISEEV